MSKNYSSWRGHGNDIWAWDDANRLKNADYLKAATNPVILAQVQNRIKKSSGRTVGIPIYCNGHATGNAVALTVDDGVIQLVYLTLTDNNRPITGLRLIGEVGTPLLITCAVCETRTARNEVWMLRHTLAELLAASPTRRPRLTITT